MPLSVAWLRRFRFGPVEWVWWTLTYEARQPMRRDARETASRPDPVPAPLSSPTGRERRVPGAGKHHDTEGGDRDGDHAEWTR